MSNKATRFLYLNTCHPYVVDTSIPLVARNNISNQFSDQNSAMDSDSTVTSLEENTENFCTNPTRDILAEGITNLFKPTIERLDERVASTIQLQAELRGQLDALAAQLRDIEKAQSQIPEFADKVKELLNVKHKVTVISNVLVTSQERLTGLHKLIEKEQRRRQALLDSALSTNIS